MSYLFVAGRVLYGGFFLLAGIDHFRRVDMMRPMQAPKGFRPRAWPSSARGCSSSSAA